MLESIIWYVCTLGSAALFFGIGMHAQGRKKPMHFWACSELRSDEIADVKAYNAENARMWKRYSIWFLLSSLAWIWSSTAALILLLAGGAAGTAILVHTYLKIEKKYRVR